MFYVSIAAVSYCSVLSIAAVSYCSVLSTAAVSYCTSSRRLRSGFSCDTFSEFWL